MFALSKLDSIHFLLSLWQYHQIVTNLYTQSKMLSKKDSQQ